MHIAAHTSERDTLLVHTSPHHATNFQREWSAPQRQSTDAKLTNHTCSFYGDNDTQLKRTQTYIQGEISWAGLVRTDRLMRFVDKTDSGSLNEKLQPNFVSFSILCSHAHGPLCLAVSDSVTEFPLPFTDTLSQSMFCRWRTIDFYIQHDDGHS